MTLHSRFFRSVSAICCGTLIALPFQNGSVSSAAPDPATTLANSLRALQDGEDTAPRDHWDPKYVEAQVGNDPARTFAWVRDHTYWIPYHGILRGPVGVLMDRQGDSLDRALLLATMLKDEGQTVRLAHRTIAADAVGPILVEFAKTRAAGLFKTSATRPATQTDPSSILATRFQLDPSSIRQTLQAQVRATTEKATTLSSRLGEQSRRLFAATGRPADAGASANLNAAVVALQDYWWVQTLRDAGWRDWDLVRAPAGAADRTADPANLPDGLYHQITLRVVAEKCQGDATSETVVLEHAWRPASTIGQPISLTFASGRWPTPFPYAGLTIDQSLRKFAGAQNEWTPVLSIGKDHVQQSAITASGTLTMSTNGNDALAVARNATRGLGAAIDETFGSSPAPTAAAQPAQLSAIWIEYQIDRPGASSRKIRREVFDLLGPAGRAAKRGLTIDDAAALNRGLAMMMNTDILPMVSELSPQYVNHLAAQSLIANQHLLEDAIANHVGDDFASAQDVSRKVAPAPNDLYRLALLRFGFGQTTGQVFLDQPDILTRHEVFRVKGGKLSPIVATDIVSAAIGVAPFAPSPYAIRVLQGVFDTNAEALLQSDRPVAGALAWAYDGARNWVTLTSPSDPNLAGLTLSADVRQRMRSALAAGHIVVAPHGPVAVASGNFSGWWQIDRETGETLGMGENGWGQSLPEYALLIYVAAAQGFMFGFLACLVTGGSHCIRAGLISGAIGGATAGVGLGFAGALGLSTGGEGIIAGLAGDEGSLASAAGEAGAAGGEAGAGAGGAGGAGGGAGSAGGAAGEGAGGGAGVGSGPTAAQQADAFRRYSRQAHVFEEGQWPEYDAWRANPNSTAADFPKTGGPDYQLGPGGQWDLVDPPPPATRAGISPKAYDPLEPAPATGTPTVPTAPVSPKATTLTTLGNGQTIPAAQGAPTVGAGSGTLPLLPGCALPCTPGGTATLVGLGGAIGALGAS